MWWTIVIVAAVILGIAVLRAIASSRQEAARSRWLEMEKIRLELSPGARFSTRGTYGDILKGRCIRIIDEDTMDDVGRSLAAAV